MTLTEALKTGKRLKRHHHVEYMTTNGKYLEFKQPFTGQLTTYVISLEDTIATDWMIEEELENVKLEYYVNIDIPYIMYPSHPELNTYKITLTAEQMFHINKIQDKKVLVVITGKRVKS